MIYLFENPGQITEDLLTRMLRVLPAERSGKALTYRRTIDQKQSAAAGLLLIRGLQHEYGIRGFPAISYGKCGKPYLARYPEIHFNISHCRSAAACAVSGTNAGIDAECVEPFDESLARKIGNDREFTSMLAADRPDIAFTVLWTVKESILKFTGEGLCDDIRDVMNLADVSCHSRIGEAAGGLYVLSVCQPTDSKAGADVQDVTLPDLIEFVGDLEKQKQADEGD